MMTPSKPVNLYISIQICLMLQNHIFSLDFYYFKHICGKVMADDDVIMHDDIACMMMSSLIYFVDYYWQFFVTEI